MPASAAIFVIKRTCTFSANKVFCGFLESTSLALTRLESVADDMCVQGCHILRFLKNNTRSHVLDLYVVFMQKGIKIGPVVSDRIVFDNRIVKFVFL